MAPTSYEVKLVQINSFLLILFFIFLISFLLLGLGLLLRRKKSKCSKLIRPFECGFYIKFWFRKPFRLHFLRLSLIFLVFDLELILLFPLFRNFGVRSTFLTIVSFLVFLLILTLLLFLEWNQLILEWVA